MLWKTEANQRSWYLLNAEGPRRHLSPPGGPEGSPQSALWMQLWATPVSAVAVLSPRALSREGSDLAMCQHSHPLGHENLQNCFSCE